MWRRWQTRGYPERMLTEAEAVARVRQYADANGRQFSEPIDISLVRRARDPGNRKAGFRLVYKMALGTSIPGPLVEVDASDGEVIEWRSLLR